MGLERARVALLVDRVVELLVFAGVAAEPVEQTVAVVVVVGAAVVVVVVGASVVVVGAAVVVVGAAVVVVGAAVVVVGASVVVVGAAVVVVGISYVQQPTVSHCCEVSFHRAIAPISSNSS